MKTLTLAIPAALFISAGIAASGFFIGNGLGKLQRPSHHVSVKGLAEKTVKADEAILKMNIEFSGDELGKLYEGMDRAQNEVIAFLSSHGMNRNQIQVDPITITDNANVTRKADEKVTRYRATNTITATTQDISQLRSAIEETKTLLQNGVVVNSTDIQYQFTKLNDIKPEMLTEATLNARKAAQQFAINSHSKLGKIRSASQGQFIISSADGSYGSQDPMKKVRVVSSVQYDLE